MLRPSKALSRFEARYARDRVGALPFQEALEVFEALWAEARALNPDFPSDWREDIEPDLQVARGVNGLPPAP